MAVQDPKTSPGSRQIAGPHWLLRVAKARLSEVVERAMRQAQVLTVRGQPKAIVISTEEYARLKGQQSGRALVELLRNSPLKEIEIEHQGVRAPVRDVKI
jgi:antitoxin Phd